MLTPKKFAELHGVAYTTVLYWISKGLLAGVESVEMPDGRTAYAVPADTQPPELQRGNPNFKAKS